MADASRFLSLLREFGEVLGIQDLTLDDEGGCCLSFDDQVVDLCYLPEKECVVIMSTLGRAPEEKRVALYQEMMAANLYRHDMAQAALSYETITDSVILVLMHEAQSLDLAQFEQIIERFANIAISWRQRIQDAASSSATSEGGALPAADDLARPDMLV